jgi:hypothetical protein
MNELRQAVTAILVVAYFVGCVLPWYRLFASEQPLPKVTLRWATGTAVLLLISVAVWMIFSAEPWWIVLISAIIATVVAGVLLISYHFFFGSK